jgi:hypothetical protein
MDSELESLKRDIDLRAYAAAQGYRLDRRESWHGSAVMRHVNGDKIIIKRAADGHYVYFSVHQDNDSGSIVDFVQNRQRLSLGAIRKELRAYIGMPASRLSAFAPLAKTSKDRLRVETEFARMRDAPRHPYLENERALPTSLLGLPRFAGRIRIDARSNAVFPHFDGDGLCGYEIKNRGFTGFSSGGTKGLWLSHEQPEDDRLVFSESSIDSLSYAVLFPSDRARYASIGGKLNPIQPILIRAAIARMPLGAEIISAMDSDDEGGRLTEIVRGAVKLSGRDDLQFRDHRPSGAKDWNDILRETPKLLIPYRPQEPTVA